MQANFTERMTYLDFEKPVEELEKELEKLKEMSVKSKVDLSKSIAELEEKVNEKIIELYSNLTPWQRVQVSRHPERPYTLAYIDYVTNKTFIELHGDRTEAHEAEHERRWRRYHQLVFPAVGVWHGGASI